MADYHTIIRQAVQRDPANTAESRRAIYQRARTALLSRLGGLSEEEIDKQRASVEEAIRKVESEMTQGGPPADRAQKPAPTPQSTPPSSAGAPKPTPPGPDRAPKPEPVRLQPREQPAEAPPSQPPPPREPDKPVRSSPLQSGRGGALKKPEVQFDEEPAPPPPTSQQRSRWAQPEETDEPDDDDRPDRDDDQEPDDELEDIEDQDEDDPRPRSSLALIVGAALVLLLVAGAGFAFRNELLSLFEASPSQPVADAGAPPEEIPAPPPAEADNEQIPDRVPPEGETPQTPPAPQREVMASVAGVEKSVSPQTQTQRSVLYEEGDPGEAGFTHSGTVAWTAERDETAPSSLVIRGLVDIPDRSLKLLLTLRRNADPALPASHIIELLFEAPKTYTAVNVDRVPGILMKSNEPARGVALAGAVKRATENYFLVGLSGSFTDRSRNADLMRTKGWIDVPILYVNKKRAILTIEKGPLGDKIFSDAFASWGE